MKVEQLCAEAQRASRVLAGLSRARKDEALFAIADALRRRSAEILTENDEDVRLARENRLADALVDRLLLDDDRLRDVEQAVRDIAALPDPVGQLVDGWRLDNGVELRKVRVPLGVIAVIYEARPNVTVDAAALCLKSGNAVILRGGSAALHTNRILAEVVQGAVIEVGSAARGRLVSLAGPQGAGGAAQAAQARRPRHPSGWGGAQGLPPRAQQGAGRLRRRRQLPRVRGRGRRPRQGAAHHRQRQVPAAGRVQRRRDAAGARGRRGGVPAARRRGAQAARRRARRGQGGRGHHRRPGAQARQQGALRHGVPGAQAGRSRRRLAGRGRRPHRHVRHPALGGDRHARTSPPPVRFTAAVDAACVYVNASTRFTDGGQFGLGAEMGISTQKLHVRGPIALQELTCVKYELWGDGQVRG